ncbi:hypothetical protein KI387_005168, partial [Taxus chinensis]
MMNISGRPSVATALKRNTGQPFFVPDGNRGSVTVLEFLLRDVLLNIQPLQEDHDKRLRIIAKITAVLQDLEPLKGASIKPFGSFVSNLYTRWGDLDISIELLADGRQSLEVGKNKKRRILSSIKQALTKRGVTRSVQFIPTARVPLLIFEDAQSQISCDISINNGSGFLKSKFLCWISEIDSRCRELIFMIKYWAKAHNINDPKTGTLNSFSLSLLVIFHLQTQSPPILPPVKDIYDGDVVSDISGMNGMNEMQIENRCIHNARKFKQQGFGSENKSTIVDLFVSFFAQYTSVAEKWLTGFAVCTFTGKWINTFSSECRIKKRYAIT